MLKNNLYLFLVLSLLLSHHMLCVVYVSPKGQVGEEGDRQEDGRDSTANKCDKGEDGGLQTAGHRLSEEVLQSVLVIQNNIRTTFCLKFHQNYKKA